MSKKKMSKQNPRIKEKIREIDAEEEEKKSSEKAIPLPPLKKCWVVEENRIGVFNATAAAWTYIDWEIYQQFIQNFMITGCQLSPDKKIFQYLAFSPLFDKVSRLEPKPQVPLYQLNIVVDEKKKVKVTAKKMEPSKIVNVPKGVKIVGKDGKELKL